MMVFVPIQVFGELSEEPMCAFLNTVTDRFEENGFGCHTFGSDDEVGEHAQAERLRALVPKGFWAALTLHPEARR